MQQRSLLSSLLVLVTFALACPATAATLVRGPYLQTVDHDSAIVGVMTGQSCAVQVRYGVGADLSQSASSAAAAAQQFVTLEGLQPGTEYGYTVEACGTATGEGGKFRTAPAATDQSVHFAAMGDFGTGGDPQVKNAQAMAKVNPEFWLALGDNAYASGTQDEFQTRFFDPMKSLLANVPLFPVLGNHEYVTDNGQPYLDNFDLPKNNPRGTERYYSFDWGFVHIAALDSTCAIGISTSDCNVEDQKAWLAQDLAQSKAPWKMVMFHHPIYSSGDHGGHAKMQQFKPILEAAGVDLVLTGHDHNYERTHPMLQDAVVAAGTPGAITYLVVGTGGASLRPFDTGAPEWSAFRSDGVMGYLDVSVVGGTLTAKLVSSEDGQVKDQFTLTKPVPPTVDIIAEPTKGAAPLQANFTAKTQPAEATVTWDFGDGQQASGPTVSHSFTTPGTFQVTATATSGGQSTTATTTVVADEQGTVTTPPVQEQTPTTPGETPVGGEEPAEEPVPGDETSDSNEPPLSESSEGAGCAAGGLTTVAPGALALLAVALRTRLRRRRLP